MYVPPYTALSRANACTSGSDHTSRHGCGPAQGAEGAVLDANPPKHCTLQMPWPQGRPWCGCTARLDAEATTLLMRWAACRTRYAWGAAPSKPLQDGAMHAKDSALAHGH
jgi:hypothetical protein